MELKVVVDGAKNPELIPDDLAMRHFLLSIAESRSATPIDIGRRSSHLRDAGLSAADGAALVRALDGAREEIGAIQDERDALDKDKTISDGDRAATLDSLKNCEHAAIDAAASRVSALLSTGGRQKLQGYLNEYVKRHIQILGNQ